MKLSGINEIFSLKNDIQTDNSRTIEELKEKYKNCRKCPLFKERTNLVYGEGSSSPILMLIGEGPGGEEDKTGKPFVGRAGQLLTKMLKAINIERDEVYITNIVKCRPPQNRNPLPSESEICIKYLYEQIELLNPRLILLLGKVASVNLLKKNLKIDEFRKEVFFFNNAKTFVTYHPSALLRNENLKKYAWDDLKKLRIEYDKILAEEH
ncbi:MAG: uracil-DNA glycosylase [Candidatus Cloacimonetes bacterium]|nr:uracil-DNA glycosylase [Candidatus Cloacimonadota bacterium]